MAIKASLTINRIPMPAAYIRVMTDSGDKSLLSGNVGIFYDETAAKPAPIVTQIPDGVDEQGQPRFRTEERAAPSPTPVSGFSFTVQRDLAANAYVQLYTALKLKLASDFGASNIEDC